MSYIQFYNEFTECFQDGFLIHEDQQYFYLVDPIAYEWAEYKKKWAWLPLMDLKSYDKKFFSYSLSSRPNTFVQQQYWMFDFPIKKEYIKDIPKIANYFEWFIHQPSSLSLNEKFNRVREKTSSFIPECLLENIEMFIVNRFEMKT